MPTCFRNLPLDLGVTNTTNRCRSIPQAIGRDRSGWQYIQALAIDQAISITSRYCVQYLLNAVFLDERTTISCMRGRFIGAVALAQHNRSSLRHRLRLCGCGEIVGGGDIGGEWWGCGGLKGRLLKGIYQNRLWCG